MTRDKGNDRYWGAVQKRNLREEYSDFLKSEEKEASPHAAHLFAMRKRASGYGEMSERDLILLLAGELPPMYD